LCSPAFSSLVWFRRHGVTGPSYGAFGLTSLALGVMGLLLTVPRLLRVSDNVEATIDLLTIVAFFALAVTYGIWARRRRHETR
jgi:hypothetical protein